VGEAPGAEEDASGVPFCGRSGRRLDELIEAAGLDPLKDVFVTNRLCCRPPNNRKPSDEEMRACQPRLVEMVRLVNPQAFLMVGASSAAFIGIDRIGRFRGLRVELELSLGRVRYQRAALATYHPAYLLRRGNSPKLAQQMINDIKKIAALSNYGLRDSV